MRTYRVKGVWVVNFLLWSFLMYTVGQIRATWAYRDQLRVIVREEQGMLDRTNALCVRVMHDVKRCR